MITLSFEDFQKTGKDSDDLIREPGDPCGLAVYEDDDDPLPGRHYAGGLRIDRLPDGVLMLTIGNMGWMEPKSSREDMERILYGYGLIEQYFTGRKTNG